MKKSNIFVLLVIIALTSNATGRTSTAWPYNAWPQETAFTSGDEDVYSIIEKAQKVYRSSTEGKNNFANLWCCDFKKFETLLCEWVQECKRND